MPRQTGGLGHKASGGIGDFTIRRHLKLYFKVLACIQIFESPESGACVRVSNCGRRQVEKL
jgi:hypothetical protein